MRKAMVVAVVVMLAAMANRADAQYCPGASGWVFDDVLASDPFCGYITWAAQNGITEGCQIIDANHRLYCPNNDASRSQVAAFLNRSMVQPDSTTPDIGTIRKPGGVFLHNGGDNGTYLGVGAGELSFIAPFPGYDNVGIGRLALRSIGLGSGNTAVGAKALHENFDGNWNSAFGNQALTSNRGGTSNTAIGNGSLGTNIYGNYNTALGVGSLVFNQTGNFNTAVGYGALSQNLAEENVAVGAYALANSTYGNDNVALGYNAMQQLVNGGENIGIGHNSGAALVHGDKNIYIANAGTIAESQTIRIGVDQLRSFFAGIRGITTAANDAVAVVIDSNGQLGTISSTREAKVDIADMSDASAALTYLRPVTFHYKSDRDPVGPRLQYGLIAEEVAEVYPGMVAIEDGKPTTVMYQYLVPMLLNEFQKQQRTIEAQTLEIKSQRSEISELKRAVEVLMARTASDGRMASR